jgi:hypothetical protein
MAEISVTLPSGAVFTFSERPVLHTALEQTVTKEELSFLDRVHQAADGDQQIAAEMIAQAGPRLQFEVLAAMRKAMADASLDPKLSTESTSSDDVLLLSELLPDDWDFLIDWAFGSQEWPEFVEENRNATL